MPPHVHTREDEVFYVLSGRFAFVIGDRAVEAGPGDCVLAPRHLPHTWRCLGPEPGRLLSLITPAANFQAFILAMAQVSGIAPSDPASLDINKALALSARHGIEMLPAPNGKNGKKG